MNVNKSGSNKPGKSALASLLNEKCPRPKTSALIPPVLQQVGKLAAGVASVSTGPGSATGNPRNKCALQPGHSLMDWIRLGSSGKDLSGVGAKAGHLSVTRRELSLHNKESDAWLAIRGKVYNVTEYLPFHPGGPEEIMRGAGIDATKLFDQIHPWVNYDQILQKCFIGRLVTIEPSVDTATLFFGEKNTSPKIIAEVKEKLPEPTSLKIIAEVKEKLPEPTSPKIIAQVKEKSPEITVAPPAKSPVLSPVSARKAAILKSAVFREPRVKFLEKYPPKVDPSTEDDQDGSPALPRFDWIQRIEWITLIFYTKPFANPMIEVIPPNAEKTIVISFLYDETVFRNELVFHERVNWPCTIKQIGETGKVEMVFKKSEGKIWDNYGVLRQQTKVDSGLGNCCLKFNFVFREKKQINHNIFLVKLERTDRGKLVIPIGKHIRAFGNIDGQEMSRSYTPVPQSLFTKLAIYGPVTDCLCLMIKRYEQGNVSRFLTDRLENDVIHVTRPLGDFELKRIERMDNFILLAAGTGITPMLSLLVFLLDRRMKKCQFMRLLFFNKTEQDIPFKDQLDDLEENDPRIRIHHVLSEPDENWTGLTGHITKEMIENSMEQHLRDTGYTIRDMFTFVCGPNPFVALSIEELHKIGIIDEQIHPFQG